MQKKLKRIDYVAPQVIDLGFPDSLYGQEAVCDPRGSSATQSCEAGPLASASCHDGFGAQTACTPNGDSAGVKCQTGEGN